MLITVAGKWAGELLYCSSDTLVTAPLRCHSSTSCDRSSNTITKNGMATESTQGVGFRLPSGVQTPTYPYLDYRYGNLVKLHIKNSSKINVKTLSQMAIT